MSVLSITFKLSWQQVAEEERKVNIILVFKKGKRGDPGSCRPVTLIPGKVMELLILETTSRHSKNKTTIRNSQHGSIKIKTSLTNLIGFYDEITGLVDAGRAADIACLDLSKTFNSVSCKILLEKLMKYGLDKQAVKCTENCLHGWAQRVAKVLSVQA